MHQRFLLMYVFVLTAQDWYISAWLDQKTLDCSSNFVAHIYRAEYYSSVLVSSAAYRRRDICMYIYNYAYII